MISSGLGEINEHNFVNRMKLSIPAASGTSVFLVAISAIVGIITHGFFLFTEGAAVFSEVGGIVLFSVPGVVLGAQLGVFFSGRVNEKIMRKFIMVLFGLIGIMMIYTVF